MPLDSKHSRGPARWERARKFAEKSPNSQAAKLYNTRAWLGVTMADDATLMLPETPRRFTTNIQTQAGIPPTRYYVCRTQCAVMQAALDLATTDEKILYDFLVNGHGQRGWVSIDTVRPTRDARCQVCAATISPTADNQPVLIEVPEPLPVPQTVEEPEVTTYFITKSGEVLKPGDIYRVQLTQDQEDILFGYVPREGVARYGRNTGEQIF